MVPNRATHHICPSQVRHFFISSICGFVSKNLFVLRLQIYHDVTKKIAFLGLNAISVAECAFQTSYEVAFIRTSISKTNQNWFGFRQKNLDKNTLCIKIQKFSFRLYVIKSLTKQATHPPFLHRSNPTSSYPSISSSLLKIVRQVQFRLIK